MEKLTDEQVKELTNFISKSKLAFYDGDIKEILLYFNREIDKDNEKLKGVPQRA